MSGGGGEHPIVFAALRNKEGGGCRRRRVRCGRRGIGDGNPKGIGVGVARRGKGVGKTEREELRRDETLKDSGVDPCCAHIASESKWTRQWSIDFLENFLRETRLER